MNIFLQALIACNSEFIPGSREPELFYCYECDKPVRYLFDDGRCKCCTRLTPDEVLGQTKDGGQDVPSAYHPPKNLGQGAL